MRNINFICSFGGESFFDIINMTWAKKQMINDDAGEFDVDK